MLGADAFIIFDDGSTDGTKEAIRAAATIEDIRYCDVEMPSIENYYARQVECYKIALDQYRNEFEWLFFVDADELLLLKEQETLEEFLAEFPEADGVAVNWCQYGSNGHVLKTSLPMPEAYTRHGHPDNLFARHVKSFVRPSKVGPNFSTVHAFDVAPNRYVDASGNAISWDPLPGISDRAADWSRAKIMHFQVRSMENFVERLRRRADITNYRVAQFLESDAAAFEDLSPQLLLPQLKEIMARYEDALAPRLAGAIAAAAKLAALELRPDGRPTHFPLETAHGTLVTCDGMRKVR